VPEHFYVYPSYLRKKASRTAGRRVPVELGVGETTAEEIAGVARKLGYEATAEAEKQYPRQAHLFEGRVRVQKKGKVTKAAFLRALAIALRASAAAAAEGKNA
jgi:signal recognition particle subunit SEC65